MPRPVNRRENEPRRSRTNVYTHQAVEVELEPALGHGLLYPLAVGGVTSRPGAPRALVYEAADLIGCAPRVLLARAEPVHPLAQRWASFFQS